MSLFLKSLFLSNDDFKTIMENRKPKNIRININEINDSSNSNEFYKDSGFSLLTDMEMETEGDLSNIMYHIDDYMKWNSTLPRYGSFKEHVKKINKWRESQNLVSYLMDKEETSWFRSKHYRKYMKNMNNLIKSFEENEDENIENECESGSDVESEIMSDDELLNMDMDMNVDFEEDNILY